MLYAIICIDKPGALDIRKANREAHLDHVKGSNGQVVQAGPFLDEEGNMCGSLLIFEAEGVAEAQAWADADPYAQAGVFKSVEVRPWNRVLG